MKSFNIPTNQLHTVLEKTALETIKSYAMLEQGEPVTVGFSGGADSVALLHLLYKWQDYLYIDLRGVHVNHLLRGEESYRDQEFSRVFCEKRGISFFSQEIDVLALSKREKLSIEEAARKARYGLFSKVTPSGKIATAHTLSDSVETVLLNLSRGTGPEGFTGIPPVRGQIIRPLIHCSRREVEDYCAHYELDYVTDSTNLEDDFNRNKIRLHVIPVLKGIHPQLEQAVQRTNTLVLQDQKYLEKQAKIALENITTSKGYHRGRFLKEDPAIGSRILKMLLEEQDLPVSYKRIDLLYDALQKKENVQLSTTHYLQVSHQYFIVAPLGHSVFSESQIILDKLPVFQEIPVDSSKILVFQSVECKEFENIENFSENSLINLLDYDKIEAIVKIRKRKSGDHFSPRGRGVSKSLKKLFNEEKIPLWQRGKLTLVESGNEVVWIEGFGVADPVKVESTSKHVIHIFIKTIEGLGEHNGKGY